MNGLISAVTNKSAEVLWISLWFLQTCVTVFLSSSVFVLWMFYIPDVLLSKEPRWTKEAALKPNNPPAPAKKQDALCTSQPLISPQNSTRRLGKLSCLVSFFCFTCCKYSCFFEFEHIFLVSLYPLAGFFFNLIFIFIIFVWFLYVPVRVGG